MFRVSPLLSHDFTELYCWLIFAVAMMAGYVVDKLMEE